MTAFPDLISGVPAVDPLDEQIEFRTLVSDFESGNETRKQKRLYPRRNFPLKYRHISKADALTVWQFFLDRKGSHEAFPFFLPTTNTYTGEYVGTGDGSTTTFNLPSKSAASYSVYLDGYELTETTDYTFTSGGGADGADLLSLTVAATDGVKITFGFTGYLKVRCRFAEDIFSFQTFYDRLVSAGVTLKGLLNA